jgi:hypothetical protein
MAQEKAGRSPSREVFGPGRVDSLGLAWAGCHLIVDLGPRPEEGERKILIDTPQTWSDLPGNPYPRASWSHLWPDIPDESGIRALHEFARHIGLKREWFQDKPGFPHYDITGRYRLAAIASGAVVSSLRDWVRGIRSPRPGRGAGLISD